MTEAELPPGLTRLTFHGPLSEARAARIVARLTGIGPRTVLDIGCGWGELMLRILAAAPGATGLGLGRGAVPEPLAEQHPSARVDQPPEERRVGLHCDRGRLAREAMSKLLNDTRTSIPSPDDKVRAVSEKE